MAYEITSFYDNTTFSLNVTLNSVREIFGSS